MKNYITFSILILSAIGYQPAFQSNECSAYPDNKCIECWPNGDCYSCKPGYIFESTGRSCFKPEPRNISGFGRNCSVCGIGNYMGPPPTYQCYACPYKCKVCHLEGINPIPVCDSCKGDIDGTPGYLVTDDCSCKDGQEMDQGCFCNGHDMFMNITSDGKECIMCDHCTRNQPNCANWPCPQNYFDAGKDSCCQMCDESCAGCTGLTRVDCIKCRNTDLWERVDGIESECYCVCYADMIMVDKEKDIYECKCRGNREKKDSCEGKASCDEGHRWQCKCKEGFDEATKKTDEGDLECIPRIPS